MRPLVEVEARNRIRKVSLVPITVAVSALTEFGRNDATSVSVTVSAPAPTSCTEHRYLLRSQAILKALNKVPKRWTLEIEQEANRANHEEDLLVTMELQQMDEENDEHSEVTIGHELISDFTPYATIEEDDQKVQKLQSLSATLVKELAEWKAFRTSTINRFRSGSKVELVSHEGEVATVLRFFGWLQTVKGVREPSMKVLRHHDICSVVEDYARFLEQKQLKWSSITNYLTAIISAATFANVESETPPPLDQLVRSTSRVTDVAADLPSACVQANLRRQAEKEARVQTLYRRKSENWIGAPLSLPAVCRDGGLRRTLLVPCADWEDVQRTRIAVTKAYNEAAPAMKASILRDAVLIHLHSVVPPDRGAGRPAILKAHRMLPLPIHRSKASPRCLRQLV